MNQGIGRYLGLVCREKSKPNLCRKGFHCSFGNFNVVNHIADVRRHHATTMADAIEDRRSACRLERSSKRPSETNLLKEAPDVHETRAILFLLILRASTA